MADAREPLTTDERARARAACERMLLLLTPQPDSAEALLLKALNGLDAADVEAARLRADNARLRRLIHAAQLLKNVDDMRGLLDTASGPGTGSEAAP